MQQQLLKAVEKGDLKEVIRLHEAGADITLNNEPLIIASTYGRLPIVEYLVENKVNVNQHYQHKCPLTEASRYNRFDIVKYLVEHGANINGVNSLNPLLEASTRGHLNIVKYLVEKGANANVKSEDDNPLTNASKYDNLLVSEYLLLNGTDPTKTSRNFVIEHYSPKTPENVLRLYNLHSKGVNITLLPGLTAEDINGLEEKFKLIEATILTFSKIPGVNNITMQYF